MRLIQEILQSKATVSSGSACTLDTADRRLVSRGTRSVTLLSGSQ
jgi:hypothetical protein